MSLQQRKPRDGRVADAKEGVMNIVVMGCGYVGLVTGACLAEMGNLVTCVDTDPRRVAQLRRVGRLAARVALVLVAGGYVLARHLAEVARVEDCMMAGRRNCVPLRP